MAAEQKDSRGWTLQGTTNVDLAKLIELYKTSSKSVGSEGALTITAEALASESTAIQNPAAEASAIVAAQAIADLSRK